LTTFSYAPLANMASTLITRFGRAVTFTRTGKTAAGVDGTVTEGTPSTSTGYAVILPSSSGSGAAFDNRLEDGSLAHRRLRFLQVAAQGMSFEPKALDAVTFDGSTWEVVGCTPVNPAGTPLVYGVGVVEL